MPQRGDSAVHPLEGRCRAVIERDTERDIYFNPEQAVEYGLVDAVFKMDKPRLNGHSSGVPVVPLVENGHS
ncbi:MAG: ATP-dependent Clp protease proteolytic subunit [Akkermansiaceae bacterium]|nr:ATP-dependent Clp protease proteolytic subunit [Akkermansiaceae bacterium]